MWIEAIVLPRESPRPSRSLSRRARATGARAAAPSPDSGRARLHAEGREDGRRFRDAVVGFLKTRQLMSAVRWISEPGATAMVTLHCTAVVLEQLRQVPEFEAGLSMHLEFLA